MSLKRGYLFFRNPPLFQISAFSLGQKGRTYHEKSAYFQCAYYEKNAYYECAYYKCAYYEKSAYYECAYYEKSAYYECAYYERAQYLIHFQDNLN